MLVWKCTVKLFENLPVLYYYNQHDELVKVGFDKREKLPDDYNSLPKCRNKVAAQAIIDHHIDNDLKKENNDIVLVISDKIQKGHNR